MAEEKRRLELTWFDKDSMPSLKPRVLLEDRRLSYRAKRRVNDRDMFDNQLIFGDNLLALKALLPDFAGSVRCVFIDPPYNTGSDFDHFEDGLEHSLWLSMMRDRLVLLRRLLTNDGSLWITIDDHECHYLKVVCDEIFGRQNFVCSFAWEKDKARHNDAVISSAHDHILLYAKDREVWRKHRNLLPRTRLSDKRYKNPDNDPRGPWLQGACSTAKSGSERNRFPVELPSGRRVTPPRGSYWRFAQKTLERAIQEDRVYYGRDGNRLPIIKRYLSDVQQGFVPKTWWPADETGSNQSAKRDHLRKLLTGIEPFATPKPEQLLERIISISTHPGDYVLDAFAGSGTTGAVAHKMGRRWLMIELGDHCKTHILPRMTKVIDGEDTGGITATTGWCGGGGFTFSQLTPSFSKKDAWGNQVIHNDYQPELLAKTVCELEGYQYTPDPNVFWLHGKSTETQFIYITTHSLKCEQLQYISDQVGNLRRLLICCPHVQPSPNKLLNVTIKEISSAVLESCVLSRNQYIRAEDRLPSETVDEENLTASNQDP